MSEIDDLRAENAELKKQLAALLEEVRDLREQLNRNSRNSSQPPSADAPSAPARVSKPKSGRKPGGQPGHKDHQLKLVPVSSVTKLIQVRPSHCGGCGHRLHGDDPSPRRHQVRELPVTEPLVFEWQLHELRCSGCGVHTRAALPPGVPRGSFGPRLIAAVALMSGGYRMTKRLIVNLMGDLFGVSMALGSVTTCERTASESIAPAVDAARDYVQSQAVKHADESSWAQGPSRSKAWLWVASTPLVTVFLIAASRGTDVAIALLGKAAGILISDRWCAYSWWPLRHRQLCWAHIKRHFQAFVEVGGEAGHLGEMLLLAEKQLFTEWHRVRDGTLAFSSFGVYASRLRGEVRTLLWRGARCGHKKTATTCTELLKHETALWTFSRLKGIEPTNNAGERAIRPGVILRKLTFGTHSVNGSRFVERILSVVYTLKQQNRKPLEFLTQCVEAHLGFPGTITGSLLPARA